MNYLDEIVTEMTERRFLENKHNPFADYRGPIMKNTLRDGLEESFIKLLGEFSKLGYTKAEIHKIVETHTPTPVSFSTHTGK